MIDYNKKLSIIENGNSEDLDQLVFDIVDCYNQHSNIDDIQDLVIRLLDKKDNISNKFLLNRLIKCLGLYPYMLSGEKTPKDNLIDSLFSIPQDRSKTFHIKQAEVFNRIVSGENIILSAPTSFGKSLVVEALVASDIFDNLVIVVPSIALIDELKKKLFKYNNKYKIITQGNQKRSNRNIYIYTQERVLENNNIDDVDFFIIDEFYKLQPTDSNDGRADRLNLALKLLLGKSQRFYMLGPNIRGISESVKSKINFTYLSFDDYKTVATNKRDYPLSNARSDKKLDVERNVYLEQILNNIPIDEQTVIYCKSPERAQKLLRTILDYNIYADRNVESVFSNWLKLEYGEDWSLTEGLNVGVAYHHGQLPRSISSYIVDEFNKSNVKTLICTSTLIEGVNTNAKNIIIYDNCIAGQKKLDLFTFNNISGRSGRMFEHLIGNVYIIGEEPKVSLPEIDIPGLTLSDNASDSLLLQLNEQLDEDNRSKISAYINQTILPIDILSSHQGVNPQHMLDFAQALEDNMNLWHPLMKWRGLRISYDQLSHLSTILFRYFKVNKLARGSVKTDAQLVRRIRDMQNNVNDFELIMNDYEYWSERDDKYTLDDSIRLIFNFKRNLVGYSLPQIIMAISDIQKFVFRNYSYTPGDYEAFAISLENYFDLPVYITLEEYGIPTQITKKMAPLLNLTFESDIDEALESIKLKSDQIKKVLEPFEFSFVDKLLHYI
ncbi:DEAD/DEAH box helicase [Vibrio cyclitrophicus]